jgi:hypothetical protein
MSKVIIKGIIGAATAVLLVGCASNQKPGEEPGSFSSLPDWVMMPGSQVGDGALAATECVKDNAGMSILKSKATALARASIAQQIDIKVDAMDKTYQTLTENGEESGAGSSFESVSKQVSSQMLQGAIPNRMDYIPTDGEGRQLCVMVVLAPEKNKQVFDSLLQASGRQLSPDNEALMYQEYRADKAKEELERSLDQN